MKIPENMIEVSPRADCVEGELADCLRTNGHKCVRGITTIGGRWFLDVGSASNSEAEAAVAFAASANPGKSRRLKAQLRSIVRDRIELEECERLLPGLFGSELTDVRERQSAIVSEILDDE